ATERIREVLAEEAEETLGDPPAAQDLQGALALEELVFAYPSRPEQRVLDGLSFEVRAGERVAIVGASGGGKSTLFALLLGYYHAQSGRLSFDGRPAGEIPLAQRRAAMAVVPQEVLLFGGSVRENIAYGRPGADAADIERAAKLANAHDFITGFSEGYETLVGSRGVKLSGGQRQRIAIARAILADPRILLLDEATSALDSESERLVQEALDGLMKDRTSLIIAHRLATVRSADRILVVSQGKIVESGTHDDLMARNGTYRLLADTQALA
ncbi:MAG: ABC transporter ATP-binding protein, partial [Verrucomicrobiales bacterium]